MLVVRLLDGRDVAVALVPPILASNRFVTIQFCRGRRPPFSAGSGSEEFAVPPVSAPSPLSLMAAAPAVAAISVVVVVVVVVADDVVVVSTFRAAVNTARAGWGP